LKTLAEIAIDAGLVNRAGVTHAGRAAEQRGVPLVVALVRDAGVDELALLAALRKATRVKALDPGTLRPDAEALRLVPADLCRRHRVLPFAVVREQGGRVLRIAMADPTDAAALAEVEHVAKCDLEVWLLPLGAVEELGEEVRAARPRRPFGEGMKPSTQPHARREVGEDTALTPSTVPFHSVADEADAAMRLRALVRLLEAKGVLAEGEMEAAVIDLMRAGRQTDSEDE
jgi:SpoU rRNA methylase family enzyme